MDDDLRPRLYTAVLREHLQAHRQMAFVSGPRQVGKTTVCRAAGDVYLSWDNADHRRVILRGPAAVASAAGLDRLTSAPPVIILDELHKHPKWKALLKGLFDTYGARARVIVTGSSRLDVYRRGGDSLMGRYLLYRMHPWSVAELLRPEAPTSVVRPPARIHDGDWRALLDHGGFPEPFLKRDLRFTRRWRALRGAQLTREDLREVAQVQALGALEALTHLLAERSGAQLVYAALANEIDVSIDTVRRWIDLLVRLHHGFLVRPWFRNVTKSLRKEPKWYLRDWAGIDDAGSRAETLVACHLLKAVETWTDVGLGDFELRYLRDKLKREADFVVIRDRKPWCLVEVKTSETALSTSLRYFQEQTRAPHALQVVMDLPFQDADCFAVPAPVIVPARTFLSQLV